jgi:hypothetical protein
MVGEYKVSRCSRRCHALDRPLREGEWYYSVVLANDDDSGSDFERRDYAAEAWQEPPAGAIGWWKSRMPTAAEKKLVPAPPAVLVGMLRQMGQSSQCAKQRYLLALMLMRKKIVRPVVSGDEPTNAMAKLLRVEVVSDASTIDIPICEINRSETDSLCQRLNDLLYTEAELEPDLDEE